MNYQKIHDNIINQAKNRILNGYSERHHIIPRCMSGTNDKNNLVRLTPEEHYVVHQLLVKIYPNEPKLAMATFRLTHKSSKMFHNNKLYGWLKRKHAKAMSKIKTGTTLSKSHRQSISKALSGIPKTPEHVANMRKNHADNHWFRHNQKAKDAISKKNKGRIKPEAECKKLSIARTKWWKEKKEKENAQSIMA